MGRDAVLVAAQGTSAGRSFAFAGILATICPPLGTTKGAAMSSPLVQRIAAALGQRFSALTDAQTIDLATAAVGIVRSQGMMPSFFTVLSSAVECAREQWAEMADDRRAEFALEDADDQWADAFDAQWRIED